MTVRAAPAILWGDNFENVLTFAEPVDQLITGRTYREGSSWVQSQAGSEDAYLLNYDFQFSGTLHHIPNNTITTPTLQSGWSGSVGVQAFLKWARRKRQFRVCPDSSLQNFFVDRCYLVEPIDGNGTLEQDGTRQITITARSAHMDFDLAFRGITIELRPGADLTTRPPGQFTRGTTARYHNISGKVATAAINVLRDRHYIGGVRTILAEEAPFNFILQSQTLATAPWANNNCTPANNASNAPDDTATATSIVPVAGSRPTINPYCQQTLTITANEYLAASIYVRQKGTYTGLIMYLADPNSANGCWLKINLATGAFIDAQPGGTGTLGGYRIEALADGWFKISLWGRVSTATPGATTGELLTSLYPDTTFSGTATYDGVQGYYAWGAMFQRSQSTTVPITPAMYILTTGAGAGIGAETLVWDWSWVLQPAWFYFKFIELGAATEGNFNSLMHFGSQIAGDPAIRVFTGSGSGGANPFWRFNWSQDGGVTQSAGIANATPAVGDTVELYCRALANGNVELHQTINGGAVATFTGSGSGALASFYITRMLQLFAAAPIGLTSFKSGYTPRITTLASARET